MTRGGHRHHDGERGQGERRPRHSRFSVFMRRLMVAAAALAVAAGAGMTLVERQDLPQELRDSKTVKAAYQARDRAVSAGNRLLGRDAAPSSGPAERRQQGYPAQDRKRLEEIISTGAQGHD